MSYGTFQGILTIIMMAIMIGIIVWSYSSRRKPRFDAAAQSIFDDEPATIGQATAKGTETRSESESEK